MKSQCIRCGTNENLEEDHIIPKYKGGSDEDENKRWLCVGCHDYRHARDNILIEIKNNLRRLEMGRGNSVRLSMWLYRLGVLEAFNTPEKVRERGYTSYWDLASTHYSAWYPKLKPKSVNTLAQALLHPYELQSSNKTGVDILDKDQEG